MGIHLTTRIKRGFNQTEQRLGIRQWVPYDQCRIKGGLNRKKLVRGYPFNYRNIRRLELRLASTPGEFLSIQLGYTYKDGIEASHQRTDWGLAITLGGVPVQCTLYRQSLEY